MFRGGYEKSLQLPGLYEAVAREYGAEFLNGGSVMTTSFFDGIHLDPEAHSALGLAVCEALLRADRVS